MDPARPFTEPSPWTGSARELLERAIARHGGWEAWMGFRSLVLAPRSLTGLLPRMKGLGQTFTLPPTAEIRPHERAAVFHDYPSAGRRGLFSNGAVHLDGGPGDGEVNDPEWRARYHGLGKYRRWMPADALYFFGYALTHYHSLPFSLVDARPLRACAARFQGRRLTGVEVELPADLPTHCRRQRFYFEADGLLRRHDYVAEIAGGWARGAHFWGDFVTVQGIEVARRRHVVARLGRWALPPFVALHAELSPA